MKPCRIIDYCSGKRLPAQSGRLAEILDFSEVKASIPGASNKLGEWVSEWLSDWLIEYTIFLHGLVQQWGRKRNEIRHNGSLGDEDDVWT